MDLDRVTAEIRPRAEWEAVDLGMALTREHLPSLLKIWCMTVLPVLITVIVLSAWLTNLVCGVLTLWWLKPLFERPTLYYLSRALFSDAKGVWEVIREFPNQLKSCWGLIFSGVGLHSLGWIAIQQDDPVGLVMLFSLCVLPLLFYRSKPGRSFLMPVQVLEGLKGAELRSRCKVLSRRGGVSVALTILCSLLESFLVLHLSALVYLAIPEGSRFNLENFEQGLIFGENWLYWLLAIIELIAMNFVSFFYVGGGFWLVSECAHMD